MCIWEKINQFWWDSGHKNPYQFHRKNNFSSFGIMQSTDCLGRMLFDKGQLISVCLFDVLKGYLSNLLERWLLHRFFVFWARDFKFWLQLWFFEPVKMGGEGGYLTWVFDVKNGIFQVKSGTIMPKSLFLEINAWNLKYAVFEF